MNNITIHCLLHLGRNFVLSLLWINVISCFFLQNNGLSSARPRSPPPPFTTATSVNDNFISTIWCPSLTQQSKLPSWSSSLICIKKLYLCVVQWFNCWWAWGASPGLLWTLSLTFWVLTLLMMDPQEFSIVLSITSAVSLWQLVVIATHVE